MLAVIGANRLPFFVLGNLFSFLTYRQNRWCAYVSEHFLIRCRKLFKNIFAKVLQICITALYLQRQTKTKKQNEF